MKNLNLLIVLIISLFAIELNAQEVPEVQRPLISKVAATWCPPCGGWGWTFFEDLILDNEDNATLLVAHHSGELFNETSKAFSDNFDAPYQPYFYINVTDQEVTSVNAAEKRLEIKNAVEAESMSSPVANASIKAAIDQFLFIAELETKFFQDTTGDFYLGVYVVESGVVNFQEGQGNNAIHEKVLQASFTDDAFGKPLINGSVEAGDSWKMTFDIPVSYDWNFEHVEVVSIIWKREDDKYIAVNTNVTDEITVISDVENSLAAKATMEVIPTIIANQSRVEINLESPLPNALVSIVDTDGKIIVNLFKGDLNSGVRNFAIDRSVLPSSGMYFLTLRAEQEIISQQVIAQ